MASDAGTDPTDFNNKAKILRSVGSAIFLAVTLFYNACVVKTFMDSRKERTDVHLTLPILGVVGLLLIVRGVFGLLQSAVWNVSVPYTLGESNLLMYKSTYIAFLHQSVKLHCAWFHKPLHRT